MMLDGRMVWSKREELACAPETGVVPAKVPEDDEETEELLGEKKPD